MPPWVVKGVGNMTEKDLYDHLKDGTELCRMIGLLTDGAVLENIEYRYISYSPLYYNLYIIIYIL